ncbi:MAG: RNA polymerase subunit sigma-24 [Robiginitomaculum sp.]|nr:MAG: RNA polymerase subunit sigma-24 [Robiginitomaculum sp.]
MCKRKSSMILCCDHSMTSPNNQAFDDQVDKDLIASALAGNDQAFTTIMRRYKDNLFRFALRHLDDSDDAEDAVQDAFVAAYNNLHRYKPQYRLSTWLFQITLNKCRDIGRKRKTRAFLQRLTPGIENTVAGSDALYNPETLSQSRTGVERLRAEIAHLPKGVKTAFILCVLEEKSHKDAGQILNLSPKAVELRVYRARRHLKMIANSDL